MKKFLSAFIAAILPPFALFLSVQTSRAESATWNLSPTSGDWERCRQLDAKHGA
jgi:hypothetical protein